MNNSTLYFYLKWQKVSWQSCYFQYNWTFYDKSSRIWYRIAMVKSFRNFVSMNPPVIIFDIFFNANPKPSIGIISHTECYRIDKGHIFDATNHLAISGCCVSLTCQHQGNPDPPPLEWEEGTFKHKSADIILSRAQHLICLFLHQPTYKLP